MLSKTTAKIAAWMISVTAGVTFLATGTEAQQTLQRLTASGQWQGAAGLEIVQVRPSFYMIAGAGAHISFSVGADGVVIVNTGTREASAAALAEIRKITLAPIRYIINTSADLDV